MRYCFHMEINNKNQSVELLLQLVQGMGRFNRRKERRVNQPFEQENGIKIKSFHLLHLIAKGCQQPGELVQELGLPNSTITRLLDCLSKQGLIVREPKPEDLRQSNLGLTLAGQAKYDSAWKSYLAYLEQGFQALPVSALQQAIQALADMEQALAVEEHL